jgi:hypothetical protein
MRGLSLITLVIFSLLQLNGLGQQVDKKKFCKELQDIVHPFSLSTDSLKGAFSGNNSYGVQRWEINKPLSGSVEGFYELISLEGGEEYHATFIMKSNVQQKESEDYYRQMVGAVRWCYGTDYSLSERETSEWDNAGKKHRHYEATFTFTGIPEKGIVMPVIVVRSFSIESGLYSVTVELYKLQ